MKDEREVRPRLVAHADWSVAANKRWMTVARREGRGYAVGAPRLVGDTSDLVDRLLAEGRGGPVLLGFDFPIGVPRHYAAKAGIAHMLELLAGLGAEEWAAFGTVARHAHEIALRRPFYPDRSSGLPRPSLTELIRGLGLADRHELLRHCDRGPPAAAPIFWTVGGNQVGKAALAGWREVVGPALRARRAEVGFWPFDGALADLVATRRVVFAETYPGEIYGHLGLKFARGQGGPSGKRVQRDRKANASIMLAWAKSAGVTIDPALTRIIRDGFGPRPDGEDAFDATVGVLGMLNVVLGLRPSGEPDAPAVRTVEGWILGRAAAKGLGMGSAARNDTGFELHPQLAADTVEVCRLALCRVLLSRDSSFPWLVLVPQRANVRELIELTECDRHLLMDEIAQAEHVLGALFAPDKLNVAALGNAVPQLHIHVVARYRTDRAWPRPIWGTGEAVPYEAAKLDALRTRLAEAFTPRPLAKPRAIVRAKRKRGGKP